MEWRRAWEIYSKCVLHKLYKAFCVQHSISPTKEIQIDWNPLPLRYVMCNSDRVADKFGDCHAFQGDYIPHCCSRDPEVVDLLPETPYNVRITNCCKGGILSSLSQDPSHAVNSFQLHVGLAGNSRKLFQMPSNFSLNAPGSAYTCGNYEMVSPITSLNSDERRVIRVNSPPAVAAASQPSAQCTSHMCPIKVHWHVKKSYTEYYRLKITVTNFDFLKNFSSWNLVTQHPDFTNLVAVDSFHYRFLTAYGDINDTAMMWGVDYYNNLLLSNGNVQSELLIKKAKGFDFARGWALPRRVYFNGDLCLMPPPDSYPKLPNSATSSAVSSSIIFISIVFILACI
ncbi:hypothetical protein ACHQM5_006610 [Ranunculus cassubicifolius]